MIIVRPHFNIETKIEQKKNLKKIEEAGRTCYKSETKATEDSYIDFIKMLISKKHFSVLEHEIITVKFIIDRGVANELVRHRIASFSQESSRYCNYTKNGEIQFILPNWFKMPLSEIDKIIKMLEDGERFVFNEYQDEINWLTVLKRIEENYMSLINIYKWTPQEARSILPNATKTEIVVTANLREWRTILEQRTSKEAHPQMREVMIPLLRKLQKELPIIFDDIKIN